MEIRRFQEDDALQVKDVQREAVESISSMYSREQIDAWIQEDATPERWAKSLLKNISYVAVVEGAIVGFGDLTTEGEIRRLYVRSSYQRNGVGSKLMAKLEEEARLFNLDEIYLDSSIPALNFYLALGYKNNGPRKRLIHGLYYAVFHMTKRIHLQKL